MSSSKKSRPIPFIVQKKSDPTKYELGEQAVTMLRGLTGRIALIAVAGKYRTGKSFLLNCLLGRQSGFTVGPTVEACTKGIWIWGRPLDEELADGQRCKVILMDTEGFGASDATQDSDAKLFSLATLLCSLLIYNSVGAIDEEAITSLAFIADLTKHIHTKASGDSGPAASSSSKPGVLPTDEDGGAFHSFFPSFLWVLRDFVLNIVDEDGEPLSARDYLENCLKEQSAKGYSAENRQRNRVRQRLTSFFKDRDCVTLVRPIIDEDKLQTVDKLPIEALRKEFRDGIDELSVTVFNKMLRAKTILGQNVSGPMLVGLAQAYIQAINNDAVPNIGEAWDEVARSECQESMNEALMDFKNSIAKHAPKASLPMDEPELTKLYKMQRSQAFAGYDARAIGPFVKPMRGELKAKLAAEWEELLSVNADASEHHCSRLLSTLRRQIFDPHFANGEGYANIKDLETDIRAFLQQYVAGAKGPAKFLQLTTYLNEFWPWITCDLVEKARKDAKAENASLSEEAAKARDDLGTVNERCAMFEKELADLRLSCTQMSADSLRYQTESEVSSTSAESLRARLREADSTIRDLTESTGSKLEELDKFMKHQGARIKLLELKLKKAGVPVEPDKVKPPSVEFTPSAHPNVPTAASSGAPSKPSREPSPAPAGPSAGKQEPVAAGAGKPDERKSRVDEDSDEDDPAKYERASVHSGDAFDSHASKDSDDDDGVGGGRRGRAGGRRPPVRSSRAPTIRQRPRLDSDDDSESGGGTPAHKPSQCRCSVM